MKRRDLLAGLGSLSVTGLAGCVAEGDEPPAARSEEPDRDRSTSEETPEDDDRSTPEETPDPPVETLTVGDRGSVDFPENNRPHSLTVENAIKRARSLGLALRVEGEVVVERTVTVPAGRRVQFDLAEPAAYELDVVAGGERLGTAVVPRGYFDCNGSETIVEVGSNDLETTTISTMIACRGPDVTSSTFEWDEGQCGTGHDATVTFADEHVTVSGRVQAPTPCYELELSGVELRDGGEFGGSNGTLVVTVATTGKVSDACVACVGSVPYEASVAFDHAYPETVRVVHVGEDDRRTVVETERGSSR